VLKLTSWPPLSRKIVQFQTFGATGMVLLPRNMLIEPNSSRHFFSLRSFQSMDFNASFMMFHVVSMVCQQLVNDWQRLSVPGLPSSAMTQLVQYVMPLKEIHLKTSCFPRMFEENIYKTAFPNGSLVPHQCL
jgi:hypothetical protein